MNEWFVPKFGPIRFRAFVGMLFLPYTGMCVSFAIIGSLLSPAIHWDRLAAIFVIYFLSVGVSAHAADSLGSRKTRPWGSYFTRLELIMMTISGISVAYVIGIYYMVLSVPLLWPIAIAEGFFLVAYNCELFNGFFHNNKWFATSWGSLPLLAGYVIQTNSISELSIIAASIAYVVSYSEIRISRVYKELKRGVEQNQDKAGKLEHQLKLVSLSTVIFTLFCICIRYFELF
ncbi:MAG: hypothetical protein M3O24_01385 [Thermoproteota archaeon]|nr:hypothetical protein [Thermoproteota archaeon]